MIPGKTVNHIPPQRRVRYQRPSELYDTSTTANFSTAYSGVQRLYQGFPGVVQRVSQNRADYRNRCSGRVQQLKGSYSGYYQDSSYRDYCSAYYADGFYGGYYYPVRTCDDIDTYFPYPVVYWLYVATPEEDYYRAYYGSDYDTYPVEPFPYANDYYPTDTLRDLAIDISGMSAAMQANFRSSMVDLTAALESLITQRLGAELDLSDDQVVVDYYDNLQDQAIVLEGFVDGNDLHVPFKAFIDLSDSTRTTLFAPSGDNPTDDDLTALRWINDQITALGGDPLAAVDEPTVDNGNTGN